MSTELHKTASLGAALITILFAVFMNLAATPLWFVLFSGSAPPWPGALAVLALGAYAMTRVVGAHRPHLYLGALVVGWVSGFVIWVALEPAYGFTNDLGRVTLGAVLHSLVLAFWSAAACWVGVRYATHPSFLNPGAVRMMTTWGWRVLVGGVIVAALIGADGDRALEESVWVVPAAMVSWVSLTALGELHRSGLSLGRRVGSVSPRRHWLSTSGVTVVGVLVISLVADAVLPVAASGPGMSVLGRGLGWVMNGIYRVVGPLVVLIGDFILRLFNDPSSVTSVNFDDGSDQPTSPDIDQIPIASDSDSLAWVVVAVVALLIVVFVLVWARRRTSTVEVDGTEIDRVSLFETRLLGGQMRSALRRRRPARSRARSVDLTKPPVDVHEAWSYLEALAGQRGATRQSENTVRDFASRLTGRWPEVGTDIAKLSEVYERVEYGGWSGGEETAIRAWQAIHPVLTEGDA